MDGDNNNNNNNNDSTRRTLDPEQLDHNRKSQRRVQFAAFDDTAVVRAPSDVLEGSYKPQEHCVQALLSVIDVIEELFPQALGGMMETTTTTATTTTTTIVMDIIAYLDTEFLRMEHDTICVESILAMNHQSIPIRRIEKAAIAYSKDLLSLINPDGHWRNRVYATACATNADGGYDFDSDDDDDDDNVNNDGTDNDNDIKLRLFISALKNTSIIVPIRLDRLGFEFQIVAICYQPSRYISHTFLTYFSHIPFSHIPFFHSHTTLT